MLGKSMSPMKKYVAIIATFSMMLIGSRSFALDLVYYFHNDHHGTPQVMTDQTGRIVWKAEYEPFGKEVVDEDPDGDGMSVENNLRFPGQYFDAETGLHYNYHRDYDPWTGRYLEADPIGIQDGINHLYIYVSNNPILLVDQYGLAYFAKRPLSHWPWLGPASCNSGSVDDEMNTEVSHEHLFYEDGQIPSNIGFGNRGLFSENKPSGYRCRSEKYSDCIMRKAVDNVSLTPYSALWKRNGYKYNCQDWAELVREEYRKLSADPSVKCECEK